MNSKLTDHFLTVVMILFVVIFIYSLILFYKKVKSLKITTNKPVEITTKTFITPELEIHSKNGVLDTTYIYTFKSK